MDDPVGAHLSIELAGWRDDPITGTVSYGYAAPVAFVGWVGLITAVERLRERGSGVAASSPSIAH